MFVADVARHRSVELPVELSVSKLCRSWKGSKVKDKRAKERVHLSARRIEKGELAREQEFNQRWKLRVDDKIWSMRRPLRLLSSILIYFIPLSRYWKERRLFYTGSKPRPSFLSCNISAIDTLTSDKAVSSRDNWLDLTDYISLN